MSKNISRRHFLGSTLLLCTLPTHVFANRKNEVALRFAVMSDVHYSGNLNAPEVARFKKALDFMRRQANFDAIVVAGDMSNNGTAEQITPFKQHLDEGLPATVRRLICMGNHEFYGGSKSLWEETFRQPANTREVVGGYHFIGISPEKGTAGNGDYLYCMDWIEQQLDIASKDAPEKPIFVFQHYHITGTVYGSLPDDNSSGTIDLFKLFQKYPRIVDFSGHSHYPITDPRSAWQGNFSAFGTGTLSYFGMTPKEPGCPRRVPGAFNVGQFYVVEVLKDRTVVLEPYDLITDAFYDTVYIITEPGNVEKYLYTDARYQKAGKPSWKPGAFLTVQEVEPLGATFRFLQARDDDKVHSYRLSFRRQAPDGTVEPFVFHAWSNYFFNNMPPVLSVPVYCLEPDSQYQLSVTALNCFQKESDETLDIEFRTPPDAMLPPDHAADRPGANVLDIRFAEGGAVNAPSNDDMKKPVETFGKPSIVPEAGGFAARFDGKADAFIVRFSDADYAKLRRRISIGTCFSFKEFSQERRTSTVFSNTEFGGYCISVNNQNKGVDFWINIGGNYEILSHPITPGGLHTVFGTYDGKEIVLYVDGKAVVRRKKSGPIHYPTIEAAKAFCVAGDITGEGKPSNYYDGTISFARVYAWALREDQVKNLSGIET